MTAFTYPWRFDSRRSAVHATGGMVATSHPLAAQAGVHVLQHGGTAADAAVTTAAVLGVVEPNMTGIGGDAFFLAQFDGDYAGYNGSGGAPAAADLETYRERSDATEDGAPAVPETGGLPVTVPGALDAWQALLNRYGDWTLADCLDHAIPYARDGFPVSEYVAHQWAQAVPKLRAAGSGADAFLPDGAPGPGDRFANPALADTYETLAAEGISSFYGGDVGGRVVETVREAGGLLTRDDLAAHAGEWTDPVSTTYRGMEVLEHPPNGQGAVALEALNVAEQFDLGADLTDPERLHRLIEAVKLGFADGHAYVSDPDRVDVPVDAMTAKDYAADRAGEVGDRAGTYPPRARAWSEDTVYLTAVDGDGNAVSFINSIFANFGSGLAAGGFALQNRGRSFSLDPEHANVIEPGKRPYHTIIPAMLREDGEFRASWGVMGGPMQPQGHLQVAAAMVDADLNPQAALDAPRFRYLDGRRVALETSRLPEATVDALRDRGHEVLDEDAYFESGGHWGGGQVIYRCPDGTLVGGSDPRKDGQAVGF